MTTLVMNYTFNPLLVILSFIGKGLKSFGRGLIQSRIAHGKAVAAQHLASMGYYEEAKRIMLDD